jgi:hyperosmotically inducible protein
MQIDEGTVTLTGWVTMPYKSSDIERRVSRVADVKTVVNKIKVLPVSQFDDDLRFRIARAIYSSPHFRGYGSMVNPPIHIIVERGRVTLEGVVNNNVDRMIARSIASNFLSFDIKNELKTTQEAKEELEKL